LLSQELALLGDSPPVTLMGQLNAARIPHHVRSSFIANSGHGDRFMSADELEHEVRSNAYVHQSAIPTVLQHGIRKSKLLLNRYALDFFTHGQFTVPLLLPANPLVANVSINQSPKTQYN
jgi:hypothetical protein